MTKRKRACFYAQPTCVSELTREHAISASVLREVFGDPIRNFASGEDLANGRALLNHEAVVKDVCRVCNNDRLSAYDASGVEFIRQLDRVHDTIGLTLSVNGWALGWLLKTHLNHLRMIRDRETQRFYPIHGAIREALIAHGEFPHDHVRLFMEGMMGEAYFWDAEDPRKVSWFHFRSLRFRSQRIAISDLRMKALSTLLFIPSDGDYTSFQSRVWSAIEECEREFGNYFQPVNTRDALATGQLRVLRTITKEEVQRRLRMQTVKVVGAP
jgi:hypothetical protein